MQRIACTLLLLSPAMSQAADSVVPAPAVGDVAMSLAGVIVLILVLAWGLRRMRMPGSASAGNGIKVVTALAVGARERIVLVQVGEQQLLVGMGPGHMQTLHVLDKPLPVGSSSQRIENVAGGFAGKLREAMSGRAK